VVDENGWITSLTDELASTTNYTYDPMGRLTKITYPINDSVVWNYTAIDFSPVASSEFGIPAGHWRQTISTGYDRKVTYYDGLWRPVLAREYDAANVAPTDRYTATSYDLGGQSEFTSYPTATAPLMDRGYWVTSVGSAAPATSTIPGTHTFYDAIDRVTKVQADSDELGVLTTTRAYLHNASGNYTQLTDPNLYKTSTWFQAFDQPSEDAPTSIWHPEGAYTDIVRDLYGKPSSITRHDATRSVTETRSYDYNSAQELCRTVEPESNVTLMGYDGAGNLAWSASNLLPAITCADAGTTTVLDRKAVRSYDARNRLQTLSFADGWSDTSYSYFADGALASVTALNGGADVVTTSYSYNKRRLLTSERMQWGTVDLSLGYGYDLNGNLASQVYPNGHSTNYYPNALGQPTKAGSYASGVSYWPNGGMKQFTYGNGIVHTMQQNSRGLPERSQDVKAGASPVLDDSYDYDANGNVLAISDGRPGNRGNRDMAYDGLNRLKTAISPMFNGTVSYTYDVLDNLRTVKTPARDETYQYDGYWHLTNIVDNLNNGSTVHGLGYTDAQGNVTGNVTNKDGKNFNFDQANRLRGVSGMATSSYVYDGHGRRVRDVTTASKYSLYSKAGQLMYDDNQRTGVTTNYIYLNGSLIAQNSGTASIGTPVVSAPSSNTTGSFTVSWNASSVANRYDLQEQFNGGGWTQIYSGAGTSLALTGKALGSWGYRVRACADAVCGDWSAVATVTESAPTPPPASAPTLTVPANGLNGSYSVSWTSVSGATSYTLEQSANGGAWATAYTGSALGASFTGKAAGSYSYRVKACNSSGCSPVSATGTVQVIYPPASAPSLTVPATSYTGSYTVSWTAVSSATSYTLEESINSAAWVTSYSGAALSKAFASAAAGSHAYRIKACNAAGCSATSATSTVQVTYPPAAAPTVTTPASNGTGSYTVSWTSVSGATSYTLDESVNGGAWTQLQSGTALSRAISGKGDGSYAYRAKGCNVAGCGPVSATATTVVNIPPPATPTLQVPPNPDAGYSYTVTWGAVANATSYQLDELPPGGAWTNVYNGAGTAKSLTHGVGLYGYRIRACSAKGCSAYSATQNANVTRDTSN
jgi:YD repeat-containing protein